MIALIRLRNPSEPTSVGYGAANQLLGSQEDEQEEVGIRLGELHNLPAQAQEVRQLLWGESPVHPLRQGGKSVYRPLGKGKAQVFPKSGFLQRCNFHPADK